MTAVYVLLINMFIAAIFAVAFVVVAATIPTSRGAKWMAWGYGTGIAFVLLNFMLHRQSDPRPLGYVIFLVYLLAMSFCVVGMSRHYRVQSPRFLMGVIWVFSILGGLVILSMPDESHLRAFLYQLPYFAMQMLCAEVIVRSRQRHPLDMLLLVIQVMASLTYVSRPLIAIMLNGQTSPQEYMGTTYAAVSQTLGSVTLITLALVVLLVMMRDTTAEITKRSETDALSGVLNRRGFMDHAEAAMARARHGERSVAVIAADLDHFKKINDTFGHAAGDRVIATFAQLLRDASDERAIVGRLGGEEFVVLLLDTNLAAAKLCAEAVRTNLRHVDIGPVGRTTASFGVAEMVLSETISELLARADEALYGAKNSGRDRVCVASPVYSGEVVHRIRRNASS